jgi:hypothetical protein
MWLKSKEGNLNAQRVANEKKNGTHVWFFANDANIKQQQQQKSKFLLGFL